MEVTILSFHPLKKMKTSTTATLSCAENPYSKTTSSFGPPGIGTASGSHTSLLDQPKNFLKSEKDIYHSAPNSVSSRYPSRTLSSLGICSCIEETYDAREYPFHFNNATPFPLIPLDSDEDANVTIHMHAAGIPLLLAYSN